MAKKKLLLNESVTRRFMKLAELKPTYVSNFLKEAEEAEEEELAEEEPMEEEMPEEEGMEEEMPEEEGMEEEPMEDEGMEAEEGGAEDMVMDLIKNAIAPWAEEQGVSMDIAGDEEEEEGEEMEEEPMEDEGMEEEMPEEEGMEEEMPEEEGMEEEPMEGEANIYEAKRNLRKANVSVISENKLINEVVKRVAKRLLMESKKGKTNQRRNSNRRRSTKRR